MKNNRTQIQIVTLSMTFLIMALLMWGIWTGRLLNHNETQKQLIDGIINKTK